jgi:hypothetical protein
LRDGDLPAVEGCILLESELVFPAVRPSGRLVLGVAVEVRELYVLMKNVSVQNLR